MRRALKFIGASIVLLFALYGLVASGGWVVDQYARYYAPKEYDQEQWQVIINNMADRLIVIEDKIGIAKSSRAYQIASEDSGDTGGTIK